MRRIVIDAAALLNADRIAPFQWRHLRKMRRRYILMDLVDLLWRFFSPDSFTNSSIQLFYISLLCVSASSALGSYCTEYIGSFFALSGVLASWYCFYRTPSWHENKRAFLLSLGACFGWAFLSPWITWYLGVDTGFIITFLSATCVGFGCYLVSSIWTRLFELVYFNALCLCFPLVLLCLWICSSVFGGDSAHWKYQVYPLILWFMMYVAGYSHSVMWKARSGESDYVKHAYSVFIDLPLIVIRCVKMVKAWWFR